MENIAKNEKSAATTSEKIRELAIDAVFIALTYVFTAFINIKLPIAA
ncbi:MAG: ECF transporter S component, partial [Clostridiales bacterium]|nr:ECF transporter S component [Clostridiales bacterium]